MNENSELREFPVVGIGASAGGLEALKEFFGAVEPGSGMAYVVIMHLAPDRESNIPHLLQSVSSIPVQHAEEDMSLEPENIYVLPPGKDLRLDDGVLRLSDTHREGRPLAVDVFLDSLAQDRGPLAAGIVLSGTGTDGSNGIKKIKAGEGLVLAQSMDSAAHTGMPQSALSTGVVDLAIPPKEMPAKLKQHFEQEQGSKAETEDEGELPLSKIFAILRHKLGHDFSGHKETTLRRRLQRRMSLTETKRIEEYVALLRGNQQEAQALFREFLIGVTHFFRDPDAFGTLKEQVLPEMIRELAEDETLRVWVPGCSTGEEAFSLAIIIREVLEEEQLDLSMQIFGTDLDEQAIETARGGVYPSTIAADVSDTRLSRFFRKEGNFYRVRKDIRDSIVFSVQDLLADPPFSRLHMVCCRNVLIYLKPEAQKKLLPLFHYTLNKGGILALGSSESIGSHTTLFEVIDQKRKIFRRKEVAPSVRGQLQFPTGVGRLERERSTEASQEEAPEAGRSPRSHSTAFMTQQLLLEQFAPTGILVDPDGGIIHVQGKTGKYLEASTGPPTSNVLDLARQGLRLELASALRAARTNEEAVVRKGIWVKTNGKTESVDLHVLPISKPDQLAGRLLVVFTEPAGVESEEGRSFQPVPEEGREARIAELESELQKTRESHQSVVEELESANEELKSTNEELQSANEELQSTNEEHESSKEELQSLNEELHTTNSELEHKIGELQAANDDIRNFFNSIDVASIFVDNELQVRRFTEEAKRITNLIETDIGRPLAHLVTNLAYGGLIEDTRKVVQSLTAREREVQTTEGTWYKMRIVPYRTTDNRIDGAVLTFLNVDEQKKAQQRLEGARAESRQAWLLVRAVFDMNPQPLAVLDDTQTVVIANDAFAAAVERSRKELEGVAFEELPIPDEQDTLTGELDEAFSGDRDFRAGPIRFSTGSDRGYMLTGQIVREAPELPYRLLLKLESPEDE